MPIFEKNVIENFAEKVSDEVINNALSGLSFIVENTIKDMKKNNPYINDNYEILPINEFYSGAVLPNSKLCVLLSLNSIQLELNTVSLVNNKIKGFFLRLKNIWFKRKLKKLEKKKRKKKNNIELPPIAINKEKYSLLDLSFDFFNTAINYVSEKSIVEYNRGKITIKGEEQPFVIEIYPVINKSNSFNYYIPSKNKFFNIDLKDRAQNLNTLLENYGEDYLGLCQIFAGLYYNIYSKMPNAIFIESLIANLPQNIFNTPKDLFSKFVIACNYIVNSKISDLFAITNPSIKIFEEPLCETSVLDISKFIKDLQKYL